MEISIKLFKDFFPYIVFLLYIEKGLVHVKAFIIKFRI